MARVTICSRAFILIWFTTISVFCYLFHMSFRGSFVANSTSSSSDSTVSKARRRAILYDKMARDLEEHGAAFLKHGETSQSLSLSDLFSVKDGVVIPNLKAANPPVRANVLYLSTHYSVPLANAVKNVFSPYFDKAIWFQNASMYHFSMFHASHHISPVPATGVEVEAEATAVKTVAEALCPLKIVLDRVVLTSTGVLLGCWQVISGTDPVTIRAELRTSLPRAPAKQLYDDSMLHTSFARLLGHPHIPSGDTYKVSDELEFFHELVDRLNNQICGFQVNQVKNKIAWFLDGGASKHMIVHRNILHQFEDVDDGELAYTGNQATVGVSENTKAVVSELWYVEELDVLALALGGRMKIRRFRLGCSKDGPRD